MSSIATGISSGRKASVPTSKRSSGARSPLASSRKRTRSRARDDALDESGMAQSTPVRGEGKARVGRDVRVGVHVDDERATASIETQIDATVVADSERSVG